MTIYLLNSDARHIPLADRSVQCVVTSPPYWGLRDYGTAQWLGGDEACDHKPGNVSRVGRTTLQGGKATSGHQQEGYKHTCEKCGAVRIDKQIGLERTPQEYVASIVAVMREVWRVLRNDGVLWLNLGDTYSANRGYQVAQTKDAGTKRADDSFNNMSMKANNIGVAPKNLIGIPWRVAFALQDDGWYLRSDIIWSKPNPMPESVTDRPTKAHEYIFLLAKSERYYYDSEAIKEKSIYPNDNRKAGSSTEQKRMPTEMIAGVRPGSATYENRNRRTVWTVATKPYSGAHFATFPPELVEPMILAGSRPGDIVLDPFSGSGTVGRVSAKHGRRYVGLELNPAYIELALERTSKVQTALQFG